jgi:hypothetical protein
MATVSKSMMTDWRYIAQPHEPLSARLPAMKSAPHRRSVKKRGHDRATAAPGNAVFSIFSIGNNLRADLIFLRGLLTNVRRLVGHARPATSLVDAHGWIAFLVSLTRHTLSISTRLAGITFLSVKYSFCHPFNLVEIELCKSVPTNYLCAICESD